MARPGRAAWKPGTTSIIMAVAGLLSLSPGAPDAPTVPPALVADIAGGSMPAVMNILLALRKRDLTGRGSRLDIAMADAMFTFAWMALAQAHAGQGFPGSRDTMLTGARRAIGSMRPDGQLLAARSAGAEVLECVRASDRAGSGVRRRSARSEGDAPQRSPSLIAARTADDWKPILAGADCCASIVTPLQEALRDPHFVRPRLVRAYN